MQLLRHTMKLPRFDGRAWRGGALLVVAVVCFVAALHATSLLASADVALQRAYYRLASEAATKQAVLFIEADEETVASWGAPPWSENRKRGLVGRIARGAPEAIVVLDDDRMFDPEASLPTFGAVRVIELATHLDPGSSSVDRLDDGDLALAELAPILQRWRPDREVPTELPIHFLSPPERLPHIAAHRIERGDVPGSTFAGKVVVVGLTSPTHRDRVSTPVGPLTSPEVVSHALAAVADQRLWFEPPPWLRGLGLFVVVLGTLTTLRRTSPKRALLRTSAIAAGLVFVDFVLFTRGLVLWGAAADVTATLAVLTGHWYLDQRHNATTIEKVSDRIVEQLAAARTAPAHPGDFWSDLVELGHAYVGETSTGVIAELPPNAWHLVLRSYVGMKEENIYERRRDIRRQPFRESYLTLKPHRASRQFIADAEQWTLVVPLAHHGRLYGMWFVNLANSVELSAEALRSIEELGTEMGRAIAVTRREHEDEVPLAVGQSGNLEDGLEMVVRGIEALGEERHEVAGIFDAMPIGILVADVWGHVQRMNDSMRERLALDFPDGVPNDDLRAVLARTTGTDLAEVHAMMRQVVRTGTACRLMARHDVDSEVAGRASFVLTRLRRRPDPMSLSPMATPSTHLVLLSRPEADDATNTMFYSA